MINLGENRPKKPNISQGISERSPTLFTPWSIEEAHTFKLPLAEQLAGDAQRRHVQSILKDNLILFS